VFELNQTILWASPGDAGAISTVLISPAAPAGAGEAV
jgi:hypothetical protein